SGAAFLVARLVLDVNGRPLLPTQSFLRSGVGRVLDIGAGTGRSSIMVLESRPQATLVALDLFAESFEQHFGRGESPQQRLLAQLKGARGGPPPTIRARRYAQTTLRTRRLRRSRERICDRPCQPPGDQSIARRSGPCTEARRRFSADGNRQRAVGPLRL